MNKDLSISPKSNYSKLNKKKNNKFNNKKSTLKKKETNLNRNLKIINKEKIF